LTHQEPLKAKTALSLAKSCSAVLLIIATTSSVSSPEAFICWNRSKTRTQSGSV